MAPAAVVGTYRSKDSDWITVTSGTTAAVTKVVRMVGLPVEEYSTARQQAEASVLLDEALRTWIRRRGTAEALEGLKRADVVASPIYSVKDIMADPVYEWRKNIVSVDDAELGAVKMQAVLPKLKNHGGEVWRTGAGLGEDNDLVLRDWLGLGDDEIAALREEKVI
jgi:formyl-CoA transferase